MNSSISLFFWFALPWSVSVFHLIGILDHSNMPVQIIHFQIKSDCWHSQIDIYDVHDCLLFIDLGFLFVCFFLFLFFYLSGFSTEETHSSELKLGVSCFPKVLSSCYLKCLRLISLLTRVLYLRNRLKVLADSAFPFAFIFFSFFVFQFGKFLMPYFQAHWLFP